jgi:cytochrome c oxidase assembly factor CtaG
MPSAGHDRWSILIAAALLAVALVYLRAWYSLRKVRPQACTAGRLAAFMGGLLALWIAVGSPFATLDHRLLTFHMLQHLVLMTIAAPLLLLGAQPEVLGTRPITQRLGRLVDHPVLCWLAGTVAVIAWHVPALFALGMHSETWHAAEMASFLAAGLLFWQPVLQPGTGPSIRPHWMVPLYLFLATLPCDALSAFLAFCGRVVYAHYGSGERLFDISPLADQEFAGALMWVWVTFAYLAPAGVAIVRLLSPSRLTSAEKTVAPTHVA